MAVNLETVSLFFLKDDTVFLVATAIDKVETLAAAEEAAAAAAEKERVAIQTVKTELLEMFADPELRKRYFSIVDMDELEENEYNLNIPRYVDTFEPEEEIDLQEAIVDFNSVLLEEEKSQSSLSYILKLLEK